MTWSDGDKYEGEWKDGKPNGQGTMAHPDGIIEQGTWSKGQLTVTEDAEQRNEPSAAATDP